MQSYEEVLLEETMEESIVKLNKDWTLYLDSNTPKKWQEASFDEEEYINEWCFDPANLIIQSSEWDLETRESAVLKAQLALTECGAVFLDEFFSAQEVDVFRTAYEAFKQTPASYAFKYPCQGEKREEHMLPFQPPFNTTLHTDTRLLELLNGFLGDDYKFKLELITTINSVKGSGDQR